MNEKANILIVENQFTQFKRLAIKLEEFGHHTFPDHSKPEDYNSFTERVRVRLNKGYNIVRRNAALSKIKEFIEDDARKIDIFIIDYILSGSADGSTGIDLASDLRGVKPDQKQQIENKLYNIPIIFLSRTHYSKQLGLDVFEDGTYEWVEKGYSGVNLFDDGYFKKYVLAAIEKLLTFRSINENESFRISIDKLLETPGVLRDEFTDYLKHLRNAECYTDEERELIKLLFGNLTATEITRLIKSTHSWKKYTQG